jgi:hypothetical protein
MLFAVSEAMSKQNNVNPSHYKTGGREHTEGSDKGDSLDPQQISQSKQDLPSQGKEGQPNFIPGEAPVGERKKDK